LLVPIISAQISFFDNRFPPAPATRRTVLRNGAFNGRRNAALQQSPADEPQDQQISQIHEDSVQEGQDVDSQRPIVQPPVPTQRPQRGQQPAPSRTQTGFPSRVPQQQQQPQQEFDGIGQTHVGTDDGSDEVLTQKEDSALTDISMEDVSTERVTPGVTFTSTEDTTRDDFTPTAPVQRPLTTTTTGTTAGQRKGGSRGGQTGSRGVQKPISGGSQRGGTTPQRPTTPRRPSAPRERQQVTQVMDTVVDIDGQTPVDQTSDGQVEDGGASGGVRGGQTPDTDHDRTQAGGVGGGDHGVHDDGHHDHHSSDPIQWLRDAIRGEPGADYPIFYTPPETGFKCTDQQFPGYYADVEARCQVFHICQENGRSDAFLCPNGTVFSQQSFVCVYWHDFDCSTATQYYNLNQQLYSAPETSQPSQDAQPVDDGFEKPSSPRAGGRPSAPSGGRPAGGRPVGGAPVDSVGGRPGGPTDERIQMPFDDSVEGQEEDTGKGTDTESPQVQTVTDGSQEVIGDETPAFDGVTTTTQTGLRAPNGRPSGGLKGVKSGNGGSRPAKMGAPVTRKTAQTGVPQQRIPITTTRPIGGSRPSKTGSSRPSITGGQPSIPSSPADNARNGLTKSVRPQTSLNGGQVGSRPRTSGGTKSVYRTQQLKELDGQQSAPNSWYYYFNL
ncbi:unnamed protein product, partial [Oppiella nova]